MEESPEEVTERWRREIAAAGTDTKELVLDGIPSEIPSELWELTGLEVLRLGPRGENEKFRLRLHGMMATNSIGSEFGSLTELRELCVAFVGTPSADALIVKLGELSPAHAWWRNGLVFRDPKADTQAYVRAYPRDHCLDIRLRGSQASTTRARLDELLQKLTPRKPIATLATCDGAHFVDVALVAEARRMGHERIATTDNTILPRAPFDRYLHVPEVRDPITTEPTEAPRIKVFISYAHEDEPIRQQLDKHLKFIQQSLPIEFWHDRELLAGDDWEDHLLEMLEVADVILLLVSIDFVTSRWCSKEMQIALAKYAKGKGTPIPIVVRHTEGWTKLEVGRHQALPKDGKPIEAWSSPDLYWGEVQRGLTERLQALAKQRGLA